MDTNAVERDLAPSGMCTWVSVCYIQAFKEDSIAGSLGVNRSQ